MEEEIDEETRKHRKGCLYFLLVWLMLAAYIMSDTIAVHINMPKDEQYVILNEEVKQVNVGKYFIPVDNWDFCSYDDKIANCHKNFYMLDTVEKSVEKFISIHKQNGWTVENNKASMDDRVLLMKRVTLTKGNLRVYFYEDENKQFYAWYRYYDGWFEK